MSYFDELENELRAAVPIATASRPSVIAGRRRRRRWFGAVGLALGVGVTLLVVVFAAGLHHARRPEAPLGHHRFRLPAGETLYPLGATATLQQLLANFAVLRRPQTAQDRSWRPVCACGGAARQLWGLTRFAQALPGRYRVFLDVEQFIAPGQLNLAGGSYVMNVEVVTPSGNTSGATYAPGGGYLAFPFSTALREPGAVPDHGPTIFLGVVPDGV